MIDATGASTVCPFSFSRYGTGRFIIRVTRYMFSGNHQTSGANQECMVDIENLNFLHDAVKHMGMAVMAAMATC